MLAAAVFLLRSGSSECDRPQGKEGRPSEEGNADERRAAHRVDMEARRSEREAFKKMSPEERREFREKKHKELLGRRRESHGRAQPGRPELSEYEELRAAALKARAEYEETMGEATAATYRRRSIGYWMDRVRRQRERAAKRGHRSQSENIGADAGAFAADGQEQKTKGNAE